MFKPRYKSISLLLTGLCLWAGSCRAQNDGSEQNLTVWIVRPLTGMDRTLIRAQQDIDNIKQYRETTAGSFGRPASEVGQTAGSYGKPASEEGRAASDVGQTASSYGQTASSLPSNVKSQTAGSYGQTAGSFGTSASDFTGAPAARKAGNGDSAASRESKGGHWKDFEKALQEALPQLKVRFVEVFAANLRQDLAIVGSGGNAPDVLLSDAMPEWWSNASHGRVLVAASAGGRRQSVYREAIGLVGAPHPLEARLFLEWWYGQAMMPELRARHPESKLSPPAAVAVSAVGQVLGGSSLDGLADPEAASFSGLATRAGALSAAGNLPVDLSFRTDVERSANNDRFAAVLLHAQCASRTVYCDLYPLVLLRSSRRGEWKVLQISVAMSGSEAEEAFRLAAGVAQPGVAPAEVSIPKLASPVDGDNRAARSGLDLWWDHGGGSSVAAVEWQTGTGHEAPASHIEFTSDTDPQVRTRVPAPFVNVAGPVRWRVWAMGPGGVVRLTEWRTVHMVQ